MTGTEFLAIAIVAAFYSLYFIVVIMGLVVTVGTIRMILASKWVKDRVRRIFRSKHNGV